MHSESNLRIVSTACSVGRHHKRKYFHNTLPRKLLRHQQLLFIVPSPSSALHTATSSPKKLSRSSIKFDRSISSDSLRRPPTRVRTSDSTQDVSAVVEQSFNYLRKLLRHFSTRASQMRRLAFPHSRAHNVFIKRNIFVTQIKFESFSPFSSRSAINCSRADDK